MRYAFLGWHPPGDVLLAVSLVRSFGCVRQTAWAVIPSVLRFMSNVLSAGGWEFLVKTPRSTAARLEEISVTGAVASHWLCWGRPAYSRGKPRGSAVGMSHPSPRGSAEVVRRLCCVTASCGRGY
jgi:hypothetical protein